MHLGTGKLRRAIINDNDILMIKNYIIKVVELRYYIVLQLTVVRGVI